MSSSYTGFLQDARAGVRHVIKSPAFFLSAVLTLALGIAANTVMFSVLYGVLLKPLPFAQPDRLVSVYSSAPGIGWKQAVLCPAQYFTYREENRVFDDVAVWTSRTATLLGAGEPERVRTLMVTDGFFGILRAKPLLGRVFTPDEDRPGAPGRVILTYDYWQRRFGGDTSVIGRQLTIGGGPAEIIGVLPRQFRFLETRPDIVGPLRLDRAATTIEDFSYPGLARLKDGVELERANREIARLLPMVPEKFPASPALGPAWYRDAHMGPDVHWLSEDAAGESGRVLWVLMATVVMVLLIACANVANLFLVRTEGRRQELAVRAALGAGRGRIAAALLAESVGLGLCGGAVGVALAWGGVRLLTAHAPDSLPRVSEIALDPMVLLFALGVSLLAGLLFGLIPVFKFAAPRLGALKDGGRTASEGRERHRARSVLVVSEIAMALVLLVASGLMIRTFVALSRVDPGFVKGSDVLTLDIAAGRRGIDAEPLTRRHEALVNAIAQLPGVRSVGLTSALTLSGDGMSNPMLVEDHPQPEGQAVISRRMKWISPGYFETLGTRVLAGRTMTWQELYGLTPVVMINERLAREYWKTPADAVGKRVRATTQSPWREIVGVVANERDDGLGQEAPPLMYYPFYVKDFFGRGVFAQGTLTYTIRTSRAGSESLMREIRQVVSTVDAKLPISRVRTLQRVADDSMSDTSFALVMLAIAAVVSLLLGLVGIYGVIAYITAQRTREIGIRMALGAQPGQVTSLFLRHGLRLAGAGIAAGVVGAAALTRLMGSLLFGVSATDPLTYAVVSAILGSVAVVAGYLPSRRAARLNPVEALRTDA